VTKRRDNDWGIAVQFPAEVKEFFVLETPGPAFQSTKISVSRYLGLIFVTANWREPVTIYLLLLPELKIRGAMFSYTPNDYIQTNLHITLCNKVMGKFSLKIDEGLRLLDVLSTFHGKCNFPAFTSR
jgi:hypothetical protein